LNFISITIIAKLGLQKRRFGITKAVHFFDTLKTQLVISSRNHLAPIFTDKIPSFTQTDSTQKANRKHFFKRHEILGIDSKTILWGRTLLQFPLIWLARDLKKNKRNSEGKKLLLTQTQRGQTYKGHEHHF
jgi:hypothetical protein